jgi:hypothetical protein
MKGLDAVSLLEHAVCKLILVYLKIVYVFL